MPRPPRPPNSGWHRLASAGPDRSKHDLCLSLGLGLAALLLYVAAPIQRIFGDGSTLVTLLAAWNRSPGIYIHALYVPLAKLLDVTLAALGLARGPAQTLLLLSQLAGALGIAMSYLVARGFGIARAPAVASTLLLAVSPALWFFSDTAEVHAPHFAAVATLAALTLHAPWRRPVLATLVVAAGLPLLFLTHQSGLLLFPGWVLLAQVARQRVAPEFGARTLLFGIAPAFGLSLALALFVHSVLRGTSIQTSVAASIAQVEIHRQAHVFETAWSGWLAPLFLLWVPILVGSAWLTRRSAHRTERATLALLLLPSLGFFLAWGVSERGAYDLGGLVFLGVLAGRGFAVGVDRARRAPRWLALLGGLVLVQGATAHHDMATFDDADWNHYQERRAAAAEVAFESKDKPHVLISFDPSGQTVTALAPDIFDCRLKALLIGALKKGRSPEVFAHEVLELLVVELLGPQPELVLDRGYEAYFPEFAPYEPHIRAMEASLAATFDVVERPGPGGGFWRLVPR